MHDASAIITGRTLPLLLTLWAILPVAADDSGIPPLRDLPDFDAMPPSDTEVQPAQETLPQANEETIRLIGKGIELQRELLTRLRNITDRQSADAASRDIRRIAADLKVWGATLDARPVEDEMIMSDYEVNFLPEIRQNSAEIRREGERLSTYGYFSSKLLYESLTELVRQAQ